MRQHYVDMSIQSLSSILGLILESSDESMSISVSPMLISSSARGDELDRITMPQRSAISTALELYCVFKDVYGR